MTKVLWFTGLSGSGKTTIADALRKNLEDNGSKVLVLDGDAVREESHRHLGFSGEDIRENNRLIAEIARKQSESYDFILIPIISPYEEDRTMARNIIGDGFIEVFINAALNECIERDVKGLYKKALKGEIKNMIGVAESNPYQPPSNPEFEVKTEIQTVEESVAQIIGYLQKPEFIDKISECGIAIKAVKEAGGAVLNLYNKKYPPQSTKKDNSPLTQADIESNEILIKHLQTSGHYILSEESDDDLQRLKKEIIWIIDPLDGTKDFINRTGEFTIMVSLVRNKVPILGVIFCPVTDELFIAYINNGAYKYSKGEWTRLEVSKKTDLKDCIILGSRNHLKENEQRFISEVGAAKFIPKGSSLKVTDICCRKGDIYFTTTNRIKQWDTAASYCIITEAGGKMTDILGNDIIYNIESLNHERGILVTNGKIHKEIVEKLKKIHTTAL